jgi:hypothetical protein
MLKRFRGAIMKKGTTLLINSRPSKIIKNKSDGKEWTIKKANYETVKIIDELLKNKDSDFMFSSGITVISPNKTNDLAFKCECTRPSNHIGIIRFECGSDTILTYNSKGEDKPYYGVVKSKANIEKILTLKTNILKRLGGLI